MTFMHLHSILGGLCEGTVALVSWLAQPCGLPLPPEAFWTFAVGQVLLSCFLGYCRTPTLSFFPKLLSYISSPNIILLT